MKLLYYLVFFFNFGKLQMFEYDGKKIKIGIMKQFVDFVVMLYWENFEGDGQVDFVNYGGFDKVVCVYLVEYYLFWEEFFLRMLFSVVFGENLMVVGLIEENVCIGDVFKFDEVVVQVSQLCQLCVKFVKKFGVKEMVLKVQKIGYIGFYFCVLEEGRVFFGVKLELLFRGEKVILV